MESTRGAEAAESVAMPKVSVLFPVFNVEPYVAEALASIQAQTFTDIEIVVVDDGSTDGTAGLVDGIARSDGRIRVVRTPKNLGLPAALNFGLRYCQAPLIARMDGDDIALPTRIEKQFRFLEENPEVALVGCATMAIDQNGRPFAGLSVSRKPAGEREVARTMLLSSPCLHIWLARREVYDALAGYRAMATAEDYDFLLRAVSAGFKISNLAEPLMLIRKRSGNLSSRVEQRKSHKYIVGLHRERMRQGRDSYSHEAYEKATRAGRWERALYRLSMRCFALGASSSSTGKRWALTLLSALLSPWQARYCFERVCCRLICRTEAGAL